MIEIRLGQQSARCVGQARLQECGGRWLCGARRRRCLLASRRHGRQAQGRGSPAGRVTLATTALALPHALPPTIMFISLAQLVTVDRNSGVAWKLDEETYGVDSAASTFRVGLFGLDKLANVDGTVDRLMAAVDKVVADEKK
jgi:hypothetical protein